MPITDLLRRNAKLYANDTALVEVNPEITEVRRVTWKDYELIESNPRSCYRREITWKVFDEKANRFANMLLDRGVKKGDKVGILLMNCLEWLPVYFGILKIGALAVPLNFRYASAEISSIVLILQKLTCLCLVQSLSDVLKKLLMRSAATDSFSISERDVQALQSITTALL